MASPAHSRLRAGYQPRLRRSSFNGAKQLAATQAPTRRVLLTIGLLIVVLLLAIGTIAYHVATSK